MGWLVVLLGGALSAVGAMAIYFGWEIVRDERGWSQVISGAVGLSGGIVTIALGFVLLALGGLRRDLRRSMSARPVATSAPTPPPETSAAAQGLPSGRKKRKDVRGAGQPTAPPEGLPTASAEPPRPQAVAPAAPHGAAAPPPSTGVFAAEVAAAESRVSEQSTIPPSDLLDPEPAPTSPSAGPVHGGPAAAANDHTAPHAQWATREKDQLSYDRFEEEIARLDKVEIAAARPKLVAIGARAEIPDPPPQHEEPDSPIVGQYEAGGVSYVMYADGSIRADTPNGAFRFSNISELKAFIQNAGTAPV